MRQTISFIQPDSLAFPPLSLALNDPNGLLAIGGDLSPQRLIHAYSEGIFPWFSCGEPILWWSPDPRAIIPTTEIRINRTLRKVLKRQQFKVTINTCFAQVIHQCADAPFRSEETWIVPEMLQAYIALHQQGYAHSIEVWQQDRLVGGLYGVAINGYFSGESMFYSAANASKVALVSLAQLLQAQDIHFIDCQLTNPFLHDMGCLEISREEFVKAKNDMKKIVLPDNFWAARTLID